MKRLVIVAPTFNESANIVGFIEAIFSQTAKISGLDCHLLIADSHSSDNTADLVKRLAKKNSRLTYLDVKKRGLGYGLIIGLDWATSKLKADELITIEADRSNDPRKIPKIVELLEKYDLVIGSRYAPGGGVKNWSWWRRNLSSWANFVLRLFAWSSIHEYTNLYRGFNRTVWLKLRPKLARYNGWLFVPAFIFEFLSIKANCVEMPFVYFDRFGGRSKMRTLSYTKSLLLYALSYRINRVSLWFKPHR